MPFILNDKLKPILSNFIKKPIHLTYLLPILILPAILVLLYKKSTGHYFIYSYASEGFDFLHPHFWQFMFHYDNGVFLYMPIMIMPAVFLFAWYKKHYRNIIIGLIATLIITMYIHSSWWCWNYSFSFGARTMLDFVALFGIMIGLSLKQTNLKKYFYLVPVYVLGCGLTVILYHQKSAGHFMNNYPITDYWQAINNFFGVK